MTSVYEATTTELMDMTREDTREDTQSIKHVIKMTMDIANIIPGDNVFVLSKEARWNNLKAEINENEDVINGIRLGLVTLFNANPATNLDKYGISNISINNISKDKIMAKMKDSYYPRFFSLVQFTEICNMVHTINAGDTITVKVIVNDNDVAVSGVSNRLIFYFTITHQHIHSKMGDT